MHDLDTIERTFGIHPITGRASGGFLQNSDSLIMSNRVRTESGCLRQCPGVKGRLGFLHHHEYQPWNTFQCQEVFWVVVVEAVISLFDVGVMVSVPSRHAGAGTGTGEVQAAALSLKYVPPSMTASTAFNKHSVWFFAQRPFIPARLASLSSCFDGSVVTIKMRTSGC